MNKKQSLLFDLIPLILVACSTPVRTSVRYVGEERYTPRSGQCDVLVTGTPSQQVSEHALLNAIGPRCSGGTVCGGLDEMIPELKRKTCLVGGDTLYLKNVNTDRDGATRVFAVALRSDTST